jgi:DNA helicase II / ATP-dependent DNA helicase PcrA
MIWLAEARAGGQPSVAEAEAEFERIWAERGPVKHGFAAEYRRLASRLIRALINAGADRHFRNAEPLAIDFPSGRVIVKPNEIAELRNGTVMLRRVNTGKKRTDEYDRLDYTLYELAGEAHFGSGFVVEALHLTDESIDTVVITAQKLRNRRANSDQMLRDIAGGLFPIEMDPVTCPRCPHFFVCGAIPRGPLSTPSN